MKLHVLEVWLTVSISLVTGAIAICSSGQFPCSNGNCVPALYQCDRENDCGDGSDETGCVCYEGDVRLTGVSSNVTQGNVEACYYNMFDAICDMLWTSNDAKVVCRQLGFNSSVALYAAFGPATTPTMWTNVAGGCTGTEANLFACPVNPTAVSCTSNNAAGVRCSSPYCPATNFQCTNKRCIKTAYVCDGYNDCKDNSDETNCPSCSSDQFECSNHKCIPASYQCDHASDCVDGSDEVGCVCYLGDIRLTGIGSNATQGNVELCAENEYDAICDNVWSSNDAKVVCRQLGFNNSVALYDAFGPATTPVLWGDVAGGCTGTETSLYSCPDYPTAVSCTHSDPAGVRCSASYAVDPSSSSNTSAAIGGGVGGGVAALCICICIVCCICIFLYKRNRRTKRSPVLPASIPYTNYQQPLDVPYSPYQPAQPYYTQQPNVTYYPPEQYYGSSPLPQPDPQLYPQPSAPPPPY